MLQGSPVDRCGDSESESLLRCVGQLANKHTPKINCPLFNYNNPRYSGDLPHALPGRAWARARCHQLPKLDHMFSQGPTLKTCEICVLHPAVK